MGLYAQVGQGLSILVLDVQTGVGLSIRAVGHKPGSNCNRGGGFGNRGRSAIVGVDLQTRVELQSGRWVCKAGSNCNPGFGFSNQGRIAIRGMDVKFGVGSSIRTFDA